MELNNEEYEILQKYLRKELHGLELEKFEKQLQLNPELMAEVDLQRDIVEAIQLKGAADLKNFLRRETSRKKVWALSFQTLKYAAAAVVIIGLVGIGYIFLVQNSKNNAAETLVKKDKVDNVTQEKTENIAANEKKTNPVLPKNNNVKTTQNDPNISESIESIESVEDFSAMQSIAAVDIKPIQLHGRNLSELDDSYIKKEQTEDFKSLPTKTITKDSNTVIQLMNPDSRIRINYYIDGTIEKRSLANLQNNTIAESTTAKVSGTRSQYKGATGLQEKNEIHLVNIPYDPKALVYSYNGILYLKTTNEVYEINYTEKGYQRVKIITDKKLIDSLK